MVGTAPAVMLRTASHIAMDAAKQFAARPALTEDNGDAQSLRRKTCPTSNALKGESVGLDGMTIVDNN